MFYMPEVFTATYFKINLFEVFYTPKSRMGGGKNVGISGNCPVLCMSHSTPVTWPSGGHYDSHFTHVEPEAIKLGSRVLKTDFSPHGVGGTGLGIYRGP